jgi:NTE family protein
MKIGYALGGGAARGLAHIGVLKVLEEYNIYPDVIAGTSIGAIIGALYAGGHSAGEIEKIALGLDWKKMMALADFSIPAGGFVQGKRVVALLESILGHLSFDQLKYPFACVTTDIINGQEIIINDGSLIDAIRASMSLPGIFKPTKLHGRYLVDGGLLNEVPVSVCRRMGAGHVIGVNVIPPPGSVMQKARKNSGTDKDLVCDKTAMSERVPEVKPHLVRIEQAFKDFAAHHRRERNVCTDKDTAYPKPPSLYEVVRQSLVIAQYQIAVENLKNADLAINPDTSDISFWQFTRAAEAIAAGEIATREALKQSQFEDLSVKP